MPITGPRAYVQVSLAPLGVNGEQPDAQWTATVADAEFDASPLQPGETVYVSWLPGAAHALAA